MSEVKSWSMVRPVDRLTSGDEVGRLHLLVDVVLGGLDGAVDVFILHGAEVEEDDDEAVVAELLRAWRRGCVRGDRRMVGLAGDGGFFGEDGGCVDALVVEAGDFLGLLVFEDRGSRRL